MTDGKLIDIITTCSYYKKAEYIFEAGLLVNIISDDVTSKFFYDELNRKVHEIWYDNLDIFYEYDSNNRIIVKRIIDESDIEIDGKYEYDERGNLIREDWNDNNFTTEYEYDELNRKVHEKIINGLEGYFEYDDNSNLISENWTNGYVKSFYDDKNRKIGMEINFSPLVKGKKWYEYNDNDCLIYFKDVDGQEFKYEYFGTKESGKIVKTRIKE